MRVLLVEPDIALGAFLERELDAENHVVDLVSEADRAMQFVTKHEYDAAILDLSSYSQGATDSLRRLRAKRERLPILVLANGMRAEQRAQMLDLGADDLLPKPFAFSELSARLRALMRRGSHHNDAILRVEDLELSRVQRSVTRSGQKIDLTPKEFALLEYLMLNAGQRVTRSEIITNVWNLSFETVTNIVDVYINYVRKKVDKSSDYKLIHTIRGVGYTLQPQRVASNNVA
jgi:two-component system, OmpR family, copper resistance phosphate regulon response regulator CusR